MSVGTFSRALFLTLLLTTYAAALDERVSWSGASSSPSLRGPAPSEPYRVEKFILNSAAAATTPAETIEVGDSAGGAEPAAAVSLILPSPPLELPARPSLIDRAYADAYAILSENNSCSGFFGGPRLATVVLNGLRPRLKTTVLSSNVGIVMYGPIINGTDARTGLRYRLFKTAQVNLRGPFFHSASNLTQTFFRSIGGYAANTRKARVLMLLHELGHLAPAGGGGGWLLPDDGGDPVRVSANTDTVMGMCAAQIDSLE